MDDFPPKDEALEYWFWVLRVGDLSFLVDFILRRGVGEAENRVSVWLRGEGRIEHVVESAWTESADAVSIGGGRGSPGGAGGPGGGTPSGPPWAARAPPLRPG